MPEQLVLKEGELLAVSDGRGDMPEGRRRLGVYYCDTRYLSILEMRLNGKEPRFLSSSADENYVAIVQMANPTIELPDGSVALARTISIRRTRTIKDAIYEHISFYNHNRFNVPLEITIIFGSDFLDVFEVRGWERDARGDVSIPEATKSGVVLVYHGLDNILRRTVITFEMPPKKIEMEPECAYHRPRRRMSTLLPETLEATPRTISRPPCANVSWDLNLKPRTPLDITFHIQPVEGEKIRKVGSFENSLTIVRDYYHRWWQGCTLLETDNETFNGLLKRSVLDLRLLMEDTPEGLVPVAGIPWFACVFGRDSLITSIQTLMLNPQIATATLRFLARHQGNKVDPWRDEEPGKIVHEIRKGEMVRLEEIPHSAYYGSVDATPLFLILFTETMRWLDDDELYEEIMPAAKGALKWMESYGDLDGDGYIEYFSRSSGGIRNQGWKDSRASITYPDGAPVEPPVALVEVQGYAYRALSDMAELLYQKGDTEIAKGLNEKASSLKRKFNRDFWLQDKQFFAQGIDGDKKPIDLVTSNPGHCLFCGIVDDEKAGRLVKRLSARDMACGWGIRTVTSRSPRFNPMSYHQGSIWPHDNSLIIAGMRRYGYFEEMEEITSQLFEASMFFTRNRLPELFCGFARERELPAVPVSYPVSCSPQAWAAGSAILILQSILGIKADIHSQRLYLKPRLPQWIGAVSVQNLYIGRGTINLRFERRGRGTTCEVTENEAGIEVVIIP
jgi:glycogen debranching enzyme